MNIPYLIGMTLFTIVLSWLLVSTGITMMRVESMSKELATYRQNPTSATWVQKYFYGFSLFRGKLADWNLKIVGDTVWTWTTKIGGAVFILFALFFWIGLIMLWVAQANNT